MVRLPFSISVSRIFSLAGESCIIQRAASERLYICSVCLPDCMCWSSGSLSSPGAVIQLGTVTILRFIQPSHRLQLRDQQAAETVHQTSADKHHFYSSAYVYKFMEHLMKFLPIVHPQVCQASRCIL